MQRKPLFSRPQAESDDHLADFEGADPSDAPLSRTATVAGPRPTVTSTAAAPVADTVQPQHADKLVEETLGRGPLPSGPTVPAGARGVQGPTLVQRIKDKLPLLDFAQRHMKLKLSPGTQGEYMGLCPSHKEDSPSFYVSSAKNLYHCHGCGISGNVIQLYAIIHGMADDDAKFQLGRELGVFNERVLDDAESMMSKASRRFFDQLKKKDDALSYLTKDRGITQDSIDRFGIGFCWGREFLDFALEQQKLALETGLARPQTGKSYMAGRITFPVRDRTGRVVGFAGRLVPSEFKSNGPKYINSPETAWFKKSELLYGAYEAGSGISRSGFAVVVEGYMDVVALHQTGVDNAVAVMGASANENTFKSLWDMTRRVVFCLDGDVAGDKGALRSVLAAAPTMKDGCEIAIARLPAGMDPDEYVLEHGADAYRALCARATPLSRFLMESKSASHDLSYPEGRAAFLEAAKEVAGIFEGAPVLGEQIVAEARALNAAALVDFALQQTGLGEDVEPQVLRDAIALLQRRLHSQTAEAQGVAAPRSMRPR